MHRVVTLHPWGRFGLNELLQGCNENLHRGFHRKGLIHSGSVDAQVRLLRSDHDFVEASDQLLHDLGRSKSR